MNSELAACAAAAASMKEAARNPIRRVMLWTFMILPPVKKRSLSFLEYLM
jgi:hypothetical protein